MSSKSLKKLTSRFGPDFSPKVSYDGRKIAFLGFDDKFLGYQQNELYVMDINGKNVKNISKDFDRNIANIFWSRDSKKIFSNMMIMELQSWGILIYQDNLSF